MKKKDIRGAISQAEINGQAGKFLYGEVALLSVALGLFTQSWLVFIIVLIVTIIMINLRSFAIVICVLFSLFWGSIGFLIGILESTIVAIVLAIVAFIISIGIHMSAMQWIEDISSDEE